MPSDNSRRHISQPQSHVRAPNLPYCIPSEALAKRYLPCGKDGEKGGKASHVCAAEQGSPIAAPNQIYADCSAQIDGCLHALHQCRDCRQRVGGTPGLPSWPLARVPVV